MSPTSPTDHADQNGGPPRVGPSPGRIIAGKSFELEQSIQRQLRETRLSDAREDQYRIEGIKMIDRIKEAMQLPVKTYDAACTYYHKFRISYRKADYNYQDAVHACILLACKSEDTNKKTKEIICASYNLDHPNEDRTPDDKMFDKPNLVVIGLERVILEHIGFDFRVRYPQKALVKLVKQILTREEADVFYPLAWDMSLDMYMTFAPLKQTTFGMALAVIDLTSRVTGLYIDKVKTLNPEAYSTSRGCVLETVMDLLDLYTHEQHHKQTKIGATVGLSTFIDIKIKINQEIEAAGGMEAIHPPPKCPGCHNLPSPPIASWEQPGDLNTIRYIYDEDAARKEKETNASYFEDEYEEVEIEVEVPVEESIPEGPRGDRRGDRSRDFRNHGFGGHGHGGPGRHGPGEFGGRGRGGARRRGGYY